MQDIKGGNDSRDVTRPGDQDFVLHWDLTKSEHAMAVYLGHNNIRRFKQFCFTAICLHVTILLDSINCHCPSMLRQLYKSYLRFPSDEEFRRHYEVNGANLMDSMDSQGRLNIHGLGTKLDIFAKLLVLARKWLTRPAGTANPTWKGVEYPQHAEALLKAKGIDNPVLPVVREPHRLVQIFNAMGDTCD